MSKKQSKTPINITAEYKFTKDELKDLGYKLAETCSKKHEVEAEKKEVVAEYKSQIDSIQEVIDDTSKKIQEGHEERVYEVYEEKDFDKLEKIYTEVKTGKEVKRVPFTAEDHQIGIEDNFTKEGTVDESI